MSDQNLSFTIKCLFLKLRVADTLVTITIAIPFIFHCTKEELHYHNVC